MKMSMMDYLYLTLQFKRKKRRDCPKQKGGNPLFLLLGEFMRKAILANKPDNKYPNLLNGETFLVGPTKLDKGTHFYFYNLDGDFKGSLPVEWFEIIDTKINGHLKIHESVELEVEQLTLF